MLTLPLPSFSLSFRSVRRKPTQHQTQPSHQKQMAKWQPRLAREQMLGTWISER